MAKTKQLTSYEAACKVDGIQPLTIEAFAALPECERARAFSRHKIETFIRAQKKGKEQFDWNNRNQPKHFPWWDMETYGDNPPGSGFALYVVSFTNTHTTVGAALCSHTEDDARNAATVLHEDDRIVMTTE